MSVLTQMFGGKYNDEQLVSAVENAIAVDPLLRDPTSVTVESKKGVVLLSGKVADGRSGAAELQTNLHYAERYRESAIVGEALHASGCASPAQTAFEVACAWAQAGDVERAVSWLEKAAAAASSRRSRIKSSCSW